MSTHKLFKISILVLTVAAVGLVLLPASANAQNKITCIDDGTCALCFDSCQDGVICFGTACSDGSSGGGCVSCTVTKKQPLDFQRVTPHVERGEKALLAQLLSKDTEVARAMRSLK